MTCIIRDGEGNVVGMTTENNKRSQLFDELNRKTPEIAQDAYAISQSMEFKDEVVKPQIMQHRARFQVPLTERGREIINREVNVFITPATIRNFNDETLRLKELTNEYNNVAKEISQGNLENQERFTILQNEILDTYQEHIQDKVSKIRGVNVSFNQPYLGSWEGIYEPSLNMTLSISPNADTGAISGLLFDIAENTSQDAFILEERSEIEGRKPLTEFDEAGMMHYPQVRVIFDNQLSVAEKSIIAQRLKNKGVEEFSIDGDYFIVSIIDFNSETNEQKKKHYAKMATTITTLFRGEGERVGTNNVRYVQEHIRKSKYVGARNEGDEQSQTREYDRSDLFEAQSPNIRYQTTGEQGAQNLDQESKSFNEVVNQLNKTFPNIKVHHLNSEQIDNKLKELGVSEEVRKQVIAWHGTVKNIEDNRLSVDNSKNFGELLSGLYFGERRVSQSFAGITPFGDIQETSKVFKVKIDDSTFPVIDMRGESPTTDEALQKILSQKEYKELLDKKRRGEIKGIRFINAVEHLYGESSSPTQYVVFDESVIENIKVYEGGLLRSIIDPLFQKGIEFTVNGFVHNGEVYLNTDNLNPETPIHEFAHIYNSWLKDNRPYTYQKGIELINEELTKENSDIKSVIDYVKATQPNLKGEPLSEEILAQLIGERGVELINSNKKGGIVEWIKNVWDEIRNLLGLSSLSIEQVANLTVQDFAEMAATDLLRGERLTSEIESIKERAIADGTFMKAPNGKDTNLNERQWLQVRSKAFIDWFGDWINDPQNASKVVDENGEPLVIYRGDNEEFTEFYRSKTKGARYGKLFNLTSDKSFAYQHGNLRSFFVNSRNPLDIDNIGNVKIDKLIEGVNKILEKPMDKSSEDNFRENPYELIGIIIKSDKFITALSYAGYTGVQELSYNGVQAVIDPNQIKSATDNVGTFSSESNDIRYQVTGEQDTQNLDQASKAFNEGVESAAKLANEYKKEFGIDSVQHNKVDKLFPAVSRMIAEAYEQAETGMTTEEVKEAYKALEEETLQQYKFIVGKGLKVSRWTGEGEPYPNSKSMLKDVRENNHLYFLPNSEAFGKEGDEVEGRAGLKLTDVYLEDGYRMTLSEVFRVVHDYFGHGILGNQFGAVGEENATLQHLDLYSSKALPAVIFQTRGQNSWVNFSGVNEEALRKIREGSKTNNQNLLEEGQKEFVFATPKDNILPKIFNFKYYETARRINEQEEIRKSETYLDPRGTHEDTNISELLTTHTSRNSGNLNGFSRRSLGVSKRLGGYDVDVIAEYKGNQEIENLIKNVFPQFKGTQKIYEISNGEVYRELMIKALETNKFKSSVTVHSAEEFSNMRLFVTEDGSTGITLTKEGFLGGAFGNPKADRPNNLAQMMLLAIKEGALTAEAFDTVLPNYYSMFGFKAVSRTAFNDEYRPLKENGALEDWDYELYSKFNNGRPDVVFLIYDGGDRNTIQDRLGQFDFYSNYQKDFTEYYDKDSYDGAYRFMEVEAINKNNYQSATDNVGEFSENRNDNILEEEEADKNYKLSTNVVEVNGFRTIQLLRGEELLGYVRTQPFEDGVQIERSILTEGTPKGQGIGTKLYRLAIQDAIERGLPIYSDHSQTAAAKGVWDKLVREGLAEFDSETDLYKVNPLPQSLDNNGEPSAKDVYEYINRKNSEEVKVTPQDRVNIIKSMVGFNSTDELLAMLKDAFLPEGYFKPTIKSLTENGYSQAEAHNILRNQEVQEQVLDIIEKIEALPNTIEFDTDAVPDIDFVTLTTNSIGKMQNENPFKVMEELVEKLGGIKDETLYNDKVNEEGLEIAKGMFEEFSQYNTIEVMEFNEEGELVNKPKNNTFEVLNETMTEDENGTLTTSINNLLIYDDIVLETERELTNILLDNIVKDAIEVGVDLTGLVDISETVPMSETKMFLFNIIRTINGDISIMEFSEYYNEYFNIDVTEVKTEKHKNIPENHVIIKDKNKTAYQMFVDHGLLYMGNNEYKKVNNRQEASTLYDAMATRPEMFPQNIFEGIDISNESAVREAIVDYVHERINSIESDNLEMSEEYILNQIFFEGTLNHEVFARDINVIENTEHLTSTFIADFYKEMLREKYKQSDKYEDYYDNFEITKNGIEIKRTDPISVAIMEEYMNQNIRDYFAIKKDHVPDIVREYSEEVDRNVYMNFPQLLEKTTKTYTIEKNGLISIENTNEPFIRTREGLFELVDVVGNTSYYARLPINDSPYIKIIEPVLDRIDIDHKTETIEEIDVQIDSEYNNTNAKEQLECS